MGKLKKLTVKQREVLDELVKGELSEDGVLEKYGVSRAVYEKWLDDEVFNDHFDRRILAMQRQGQLLIGRYAGFAAAKLVSLMESDKQETARKACLDIISMPWAVKGEKRGVGGEQGQKKSDEESAGMISDIKVSKILAVLADDDVRDGGDR